MKRLPILLPILLIAVACLAFAKDDEASCDLKIRVIKAENGKPIRNAAVIFHPVNEKGRQSRKGFEMKTDAEGNAQIAIPFGLMRIQIIAFGFQTHGEDYPIEKPEQEIVIKMNPPQQQHSIYK